MRQEIIFTEEIQVMNMKDLELKILKIMTEHIGNNKFITKMQLFKEIYGNPSKYNDMQIWWLWNRVSKAMNWLRKTSKCFIGCKKVVTGVYGYFVIASWKDASFYINRMKLNKKKINYMIKKAETAVEKGYYREYLTEMRKRKIANRNT